MLLCCKKLPVILWGPFFVGAPVRPNMLSMPKSVSEDVQNEGLFPLHAIIHILHQSMALSTTLSSMLVKVYQ